jgi:hypothetical protein
MTLCRMTPGTMTIHHKIKKTNICQKKHYDEIRMSGSLLIVTIQSIVQLNVMAPIETIKMSELQTFFPTKNVRLILQADLRTYFYS